jgi:hypothetical protein
MAQIDVTEVLTDPDLVDKMVIIHRRPNVDTFGQNQLKESAEHTYGSVQPASGKTMQRLPEAFRVANVMSFWLRGKITTDGFEQYPDVLVFRGIRYQVQAVFDFTNWGSGWSEGTCIQERPAR